MLVALNMSGEARTWKLEGDAARSASRARLRLSSRAGAAHNLSGGELRLAPFEAVVVELPAR